MSVKRYGVGGERWSWTHADGDYVKYTAYESLEKELEEVKAEVKILEEELKEDQEAHGQFGVGA